MISPSSSIASSHPATSANVVFGMSLVISFAFDLANCITLPPPPWTLFMMNRNSSTMIAIGSRLTRIWPSRLGFGFLALNSSISPASTCRCTCLTSRICWPDTQTAMTFLPSSSVARICWSPPS